MSSVGETFDLFSLPVHLLAEVVSKVSIFM